MEFEYTFGMENDVGFDRKWLMYIFETAIQCQR